MMGFYRAWLVLTAFVSLTMSARADEPVLRACMIDQKPWGAQGAVAQTIYGEAFEAIGKAIGRRIDYTVGPLARTLDNVRTGVCQFTITSWQPARADKLTVGATFAYLAYGILPRDGFAPAAEADLRGYTVALARGLLLGGGFDGDESIRKVGVYGYEQAVLMTAGGRADAAAGSIVTLRWFARQHGVSDKFGPALALSQVALAVQKNNAFAATALARDLDAAVTQLRESGRADEMVARHFAQ